MSALREKIQSRAQHFLSPHSMPDHFVVQAPAPGNMISLFQGNWASNLPIPEPRSGAHSLFDDARIHWFLDKIGGASGKRILELGPLEGGHTFMLDRAGAAQITAVEANGTAWLKCLAVKETLSIPHAQFLLGDFTKYLEGSSEQFDVCVNCGVLYHLHNPHTLFPLLRAHCKGPMFLWTMIWSEQIRSQHPKLHRNFSEYRTVSLSSGRTIRLHRHEYKSSVFRRGFWGGNATYSEWMSREDLIASIEEGGFRIQETAFDEPNHANGPAIAMLLVPTS